MESGHRVDREDHGRPRRPRNPVSGEVDEQPEAGARGRRVRTTQQVGGAQRRSDRGHGALPAGSGQRRHPALHRVRSNAAWLVQADLPPSSSCASARRSAPTWPTSARRWSAECLRRSEADSRPAPSSHLVPSEWLSSTGRGGSALFDRGSTQSSADHFRVAGIGTSPYPWQRASSRCSSKRM
jgi:hypothetical protein